MSRALERQTERQVASLLKARHHMRLTCDLTRISLIPDVHLTCMPDVSPDLTDTAPLYREDGQGHGMSDVLHPQLRVAAPSRIGPAPGAVRSGDDANRVLNLGPLRHEPYRCNAGTMTICGAPDAHVTHACANAATTSRPVRTASTIVHRPSVREPASALLVKASISVESVSSRSLSCAPLSSTVALTTSAAATTSTPASCVATACRIADWAIVPLVPSPDVASISRFVCCSTLARASSTGNRATAWSSMAVILRWAERARRVTPSASSNRPVTHALPHDAGRVDADGCWRNCRIAAISVAHENADTANGSAIRSAIPQIPAAVAPKASNLGIDQMSQISA